MIKVVCNGSFGDNFQEQQPAKANPNANLITKKDSAPEFNSHPRLVQGFKGLCKTFILKYCAKFQITM